MPYTEALIASLTKGLTTSLAQAGGRRLRRALAEPERERALARCCETGIVAMLQVASTEEPAEHDLLGDVLRGFFTDDELGPDVGRALEPLLRGQRLDLREVRELFEAAGYDPKTLPGLDFERALLAFEGGFSAAAFEQTVLHGEIQAHLLFSQLGVQQEIRDQLCQLAGELARTRPGSVALEAGTIVAQSVTGQQIVIQRPLFQVSSGSATGPWEPHYLRTLIRQKPTFGYPYGAKDGREDTNIANILLMLRGGAFLVNVSYVRCSARFRIRPALRGHYVGFRVALSHF
ncbi:MAG: hypothetical protein HC897_08580 [Thermoanaerobaculia bacterium]|nr:hypothetical protein [Thermoanaerobaculia bacterium]